MLQNVVGIVHNTIIGSTNYLQHNSNITCCRPYSRGVLRARVHRGSRGPVRISHILWTPLLSCLEIPTCYDEVGTVVQHLKTTLDSKFGSTPFGFFIRCFHHEIVQSVFFCQVWSTSEHSALKAFDVHFEGFEVHDACLVEYILQRLHWHNVGLDPLTLMLLHIRAAVYLSIATGSTCGDRAVLADVLRPPCDQESTY